MRAGASLDAGISAPAAVPLTRLRFLHVEAAIA